MTDIQKLKALAEAAIRGSENYLEAGLMSASYFSAATPPTVLELIAEIERLRSIETFEDAVACVFDNLKFVAANTDDKEWDERLEDLAEQVIEYAPRYKKQWKDITKLSHVIDELKAENEALRKIISDSATSCGASVSVECSLDFMAHLPVEIFSVISKLRMDAERYRWLREQEALEGGIAILPVGLWVKPAMLCATPFDSGEMTDSVIDAAMSKEASHD